jgi:hypothetical protein
MSREAEFKKQRERAHADASIGRAIVEGNPAVFPKDRFGAPVAPGANVLFRPSYDFVYQVVEATPVIDPRVPPGQVRLTLQSTTSITVPAGMPLMNMLVIGVAGESSSPDEQKPEPEPERPGPKLILTDSH